MTTRLNVDDTVGVQSMRFVVCELQDQSFSMAERLATIYVLSFRNDPAHQYLYSDPYKRADLTERAFRTLVFAKARELHLQIKNPKNRVWIAQTKSKRPRVIGFAIFKNLSVPTQFRAKLGHWIKMCPLRLAYTLDLLSIFNDASIPRIYNVGHVYKYQHRVLDAVAKNPQALVYSQPHVNLEHLAVMPRCQHQGVGSLLLHTAMYEYDQLPILLTTCEHNVKFYSKLGGQVLYNVEISSECNIATMAM